MLCGLFGCAECRACGMEWLTGTTLAARLAACWCGGTIGGKCALLAGGTGGLAGGFGGGSCVFVM